MQHLGFRLILLTAFIAYGWLPASAACTRLALSEVKFGQEAATAAARSQLLEYVEQVTAKRGWPKGKPLIKSNETVSCKVYLNLGPLGTEYRCLVTATFCQK